MKTLALGVAAIGMILAIMVFGSGDAAKARAKVAKEAAVRKLDNFLGSLDVKQKEIELAVSRLKEATSEIGKQKIKAQVKVDQIDAKTQPLRDQIMKSDISLKRFRELIVAGTPGEIGGKTYSLEDMKAMATKVIEIRKGYDSQISVFEQSQDGLKKIVTTLEKRQRDLQAKITRLEGDMSKIDTQMAAAKAMKDVSASIGDSGISLDQNIANLEDTVADLLAEAQGELAVESEKWDVAATDKKIDSVDSIIAETQERSDTLSEINRILGSGR